MAREITKLTLAGLAGFCALISACSDAPSEEDPEITIAWISKGLCNTFFDVSRFGARLAAHDLASKHGGKVRVPLFEPDDCVSLPAADPMDACAAAAPQIGKLNEAIAQNVQAIGITVSNPDCVSPVLDEAVNAGIKVITFDSDAPNSKRQAYYGMDNRAAARLAVGTLASLLGEGGEVAIQTAMSMDAMGNLKLSTSTTYVERMAGIEEELAVHPELNLVETVPCIGTDVEDAACAREAERVLANHPNLLGFIFSRGKILRELDLVASAPTFTERVQSKTIHSVAFDAPDDAMENFRAGYADLAIAQKQFGWGYDVVTVAYDMVVNALEPPAFYDSGSYVICPNNGAEYLEMWRNKDFRGELETCEFLHD